MRLIGPLSQLAIALSLASCTVAPAPVGPSGRNTGFVPRASPSVDVGYGPDLFYYARRDANAISTFGTISTSGAIVDRFGTVSRIVALTFSDGDLGYGPNLFYYLRRDAGGFTTFGTLSSSGQALDRFGVGYEFDALAFAAPDLGYGPSLFYYLRHDPGGFSTLGTISTSGAILDRFGVGNDVVALTFAAPDLGYGPDLLYYIRHDPNSGGFSTFGTISTTGAITDRFGVGYLFSALTFAPDDVGYGPNLFYFLRTAPGTTFSTFGTIATSGSVIDRFGVGTDFDALAFADGQPPATLNVAIDIAPGAFPNVVNLGVNGSITVAVLSSASFRARSIDPATVRFGATGTEAAAMSWRLADVDGDQRADLVLRVRTARTGIRCGDQAARLSGVTVSARAFEGRDAIVTRGCP